jgi:uncharacterized protein (DUF1800 family)
MGIYARFSLARQALSWISGVILAGSATFALAQTSLSHAPDPLFHDGMEGVAAGPFNDSDAARFLSQATFGPTDADIAHLRAVGYQGWLNEQFNATTTPPTYEMAYISWAVNTLLESPGQNTRREAWFLGALGGPDPQNNAVIHNDQLRQRVAFALSEIFVISDQNPTLDYTGAEGMAWYYDLLIGNAFGNYRTLLQQVTLSPAMGVYLNMIGNHRADLSQNLHPDENYAREINQLFSVGLVMLNTDGTPVLSGGQPVPTYTQSTITNFAHVFTGWNWASCDADGYDSFSYCFTPHNTPTDYLTWMVPYETRPPNETDLTRNYNYHDNGTSVATGDISQKQLLQYSGAVNGGVLADGGTAAGDLNFALDNIFNHPNVGPFISKQLIQRLVTSNPSPAYVQRVAAVFNNNGANVRGDLKAVARAILLDPEARYGQFHSVDTFGKLREPLLTLTHYWRAMHASHLCGQDIDQDNGDGTFTHYRYLNQPYRYAGYSTAWNTDATQYGGVAQAPLDAFTVFNFFKPGFKPPGEMTTRGLLGPEFQLQTDSIIANSNNTFVYYMYYGGFDLSDTCDAGDQFGDVRIDHTQDDALAGSANGGPADPADALVDAYNKRFMSGQMSPYMRDQLVGYLNTIDSTWAYPPGSDWRLQRVDRALYLILTSPEYMIQK